MCEEKLIILRLNYLHLVSPLRLLFALGLTGELISSYDFEVCLDGTRIVWADLYMMIDVSLEYNHGLTISLLALHDV